MRIKTIATAVLAVLTFMACTEKPVKPDVDPGKGLLNFSVSIPGSGLSYSATKQGPYQPGETIIIEIPSSSENPVDVTSLECYASLDNNCHTDPAVPPTVDFTNPYKITVVLADGSTQVNYIKVELVFPEIKIDFVWQTMATEMNQVVYNDMYVAADDEYVYVLDVMVHHLGIQVDQCPLGPRRNVVQSSYFILCHILFNWNDTNLPVS